MNIEEIIADAPPEDLDEIMELVFGDNEAKKVSGTENDSDNVLLSCTLTENLPHPLSQVNINVFS